MEIRKLLWKLNCYGNRERDHCRDSGADRRIILRWIFKKWDVGVWTGSS